MPAHITGQSGTGKLTLAKAMAAKMSSTVTVLDGSNEQAYPNGLSNDFEAALNDGAAVILHHVDALSADSKVAIGEVVARQTNLPLVFTSSKLDERTADLLRVLGGVEIDMPPLRKRRDDIPRLALHFLHAGSHGVVRMSPPFVRALTEADWPGNVGQLKEFVCSAAMRCASPELGLDHLTDIQRKGLEGSRLSRLEEVSCSKSVRHWRSPKETASAQPNSYKSAGRRYIERSTPTRAEASSLRASTQRRDLLWLCNHRGSRKSFDASLL